MKRSVLKFGGTSVSDVNKIKNIAKYIKNRVEKEEQLIVVVSAMGDTTDALIESSHAYTKNPNELDLAMLLSSGEQQTISYLSMALNSMEITTKALTGYQAKVRTVGRPMKSRISSIDTDYLKKILQRHDVIVVAGFQGVNEEGDLTTLGRGGSDITAVALASALGYPCEIYSDVTGIYSTDPSIYVDAKLKKYISYENMMEMSALGAGILETRSVEVAKNNNIPIYIGKTLSDEEGTWVVSNDEVIEEKAIAGIALDNNLTRIHVRYPKYNSFLFHDILVHLEREDISIDMISEIHDNENFQFLFTAKMTEKYNIQKSFESLEKAYPGMEFMFNDNFSKISIVGTGMRDITRVVSKALRALIKEKISFYQVTTSEMSISFIINKENEKQTTNLLCRTFDL